ncbi:MAG: choice-of-anchor X domain-containing protein, partial [Rhodothermia bacterium]
MVVKVVSLRRATMFVLMLQTAAVGMPNLLPQQPPIILENIRAATPDWSKPGVEISVAFAASDDVEVVSAEVVTERDGETWSTPLRDDGESGDDEAGDGLWSGSIGPFDFGSD